MQKGCIGWERFLILSDIMKINISMWIAVAMFLGCYANADFSAETIQRVKEKLPQGANEGKIVPAISFGVKTGPSKRILKGYNFFELADPKVEFWQWRKKAEQGNADAQFTIGMCYYNGEGVFKDMQAAKEWLGKAAEQEHLEAQYRLALCYYYGKNISDKDKDRMVWMLKTATGKGHPNAAYYLGLCFRNGFGVVKDEAEAKTYFAKASEAGVVDATEALGTPDE